jgi:hypothetical protein
MGKLYVNIIIVGNALLFMAAYETTYQPPSAVPPPPPPPPPPRPPPRLAFRAEGKWFSVRVGDETTNYVGGGGVGVGVGVSLFLLLIHSPLCSESEADLHGRSSNQLATQKQKAI